MVDPGYSDEPEAQSADRTLGPWRGADLSSTSPLCLGIIGCGRILPAHLHGLKTLAERVVLQLSSTTGARATPQVPSGDLQGGCPPLVGAWGMFPQDTESLRKGALLFTFAHH